MRAYRSLIPAVLFLSLLSANVHAITDGQLFKDWRARCVSNNKPAQTNCHIFQDLLHKESGKRVLHIAIGSLAKKSPLAMIITLPLGISLPQGLTIRIDEKNPKHVPLQACFKDGCQAAFEMDPKWLKLLAAGKNAEVIFYNINKQAISIPVSLKGITAAIKALKAKK